MQANSEILYKPACQAAEGECSNCTSSYDCVRARSGRSYPWGLVFLGFLLASAAIVSMIG